MQRLKQRPSFTSALVQWHTTEILKLCPEDLTSVGSDVVRDSQSVVTDVKQALKNLEQICKNTPRSTMQEQIRSILVITNVYILYYFFRINKFRHYEKARKVNVMLLEKILPEQTSQIISNVFDFITINKLWKSKVCIENLLLDMIKYKAPCNIVFNGILNLSDSRQKISEDVLLILHDILVKSEWHTQSHLNFIITMRNMYPENKALDACIRRVCERLNREDIFDFVNDLIAFSELGDDSTVYYFNMVEYAASFYKTIFYEDLSSKDLLQNIFSLISAEDPFRSLFGLRLLQYFLDRNNNRVQLQEPKILFDFSNFPIKCGRYSPKDKDFVSEQREPLYLTMMAAFENHVDRMENLKAIFCCIALIIVEVPCGLTAAWGSWLLLSMQEFAIQSDIGSQVKHRIHGMVVAGFSVMCWVHKADTLYKYVASIVAKRSSQSPHLNPPLSTDYEYEQHHVTWDKRDLLFEEWEVRYGLWTAFNKPTEKIEKPEPRTSLIRLSYRLFRKSE